MRSSAVLHSPSSTGPKWENLKLKESVMETHIPGLKVVSSERYVFGKKRIVPILQVTRPTACGQAEETIDISIVKKGWRKAWKSALLALSAREGRRNIVRHLNRPPQIGKYFIELS